MTKRENITFWKDHLDFLQRQIAECNKNISILEQEAKQQETNTAPVVIMPEFAKESTIVEDLPAAKVVIEDKDPGSGIDAVEIK